MKELCMYTVLRNRKRGAYISFNQFEEKNTDNQKWKMYIKKVHNVKKMSSSFYKIDHLSSAAYLQVIYLPSIIAKPIEIFIFTQN